MPKFARTFEELRRIGAEAEVSRDSLLWRQGDAGDEVVVLLEGLFDIVRESPEGDPVVNCVREPDCGTRAVWLKLQATIAGALDGMTLAELATTTTRERAHV